MFFQRIHRGRLSIQQDKFLNQNQFKKANLKNHASGVLRILEMYGELLKMVKNLYRVVHLQFYGLGY